MILRKISSEEQLCEIVTKTPRKHTTSEAPLLCRKIIMKMTNQSLLNNLLDYEHLKNNAQNRLAELQ